MSQKKTTVRYCQCGAPLPADEPKARLCQACRQRRLEERGQSTAPSLWRMKPGGLRHPFRCPAST